MTRDAIRSGMQDATSIAKEEGSQSVGDRALMRPPCIPCAFIGLHPYPKSYVKPKPISTKPSSQTPQQQHSKGENNSRIRLLGYPLFPTPLLSKTKVFEDLGPLMTEAGDRAEAASGAGVGVEFGWVIEERGSFGRFRAHCWISRSWLEFERRETRPRMSSAAWWQQGSV
jgi:hypothetical protein